MLLILSGWRQTARHPATAASSGASRSGYTRFDRWWCRRYSHGRSTGLNSGEYGGRVTTVGFAGTTSALAMWYPAPSHTGTTRVRLGIVADDWSRKLCTTDVFSLGAASPSARPLAGHAAVSTCRLAYAVCFGAV